jgi:hypothetical protein
MENVDPNRAHVPNGRRAGAYRQFAFALRGVLRPSRNAHRRTTTVRAGNVSGEQVVGLLCDPVAVAQKLERPQDQREPDHDEHSAKRGYPEQTRRRVM